jgi:hypothetical protein
LPGWVGGGGEEGGLPAGAEGPEAVGLEVVTDVEDLLGGEVEGLAGVVKERGIRLCKAQGLGDKNVLKAGGEFHFVEDVVEAVVVVGEDNEAETFVLEVGQGRANPGPQAPAIGMGEGRVEGFKEGVEAGLRNEGSDGIDDDLLPEVPVCPGPVGVAPGPCLEGGEKALFQDVGGGGSSVVGKELGVDGADRGVRIHEGSSDIEGDGFYVFSFQLSVFRVGTV